MRQLLGQASAEQMALTLKAPPVDTDPYATAIAQHLASHLRQVGVEVDVLLMSERELLHDVLITHEFDLYVTAYSGGLDPDFLRPLLHSYYSGEPGWQNPFGYSDVETDRLLRLQARQSGAERAATVAELLGNLALRQPFAPIALPDAVTAARTDRYRGWRSTGLAEPLNYLGLERRERPAEPENRTLRVAISDGRITENRNPLAVEFRERGSILGLLYDPLGRRHGGTVRPWIARDWRWSEHPTDGLVATVHLRDDTRWHDGTRLTADDVRFTYRFLTDTALGSEEISVPAPLFRGRAALVDDLDVVDDRTVRVTFGGTARSVATRAFTVPVLPEGVWAQRAKRATVGGMALDETTEALVWDNPEPVGSGPFRFVRATEGGQLVLAAFEDHFWYRDAVEWYGTGSPDDPPIDELRFRVAPTDFAAVDLVTGGDADATSERVTVDTVPHIGRDTDTSLLVGSSRAFYHLGFNIRRAPLSNARFRRAVASLLDKGFLVDDVFGGYARPATSPLSGTDWLPPELAWSGEDPEVPFVGDDGALDVDRAREAFVSAGYRYDAQGRLRHQ